MGVEKPTVHLVTKPSGVLGCRSVGGERSNRYEDVTCAPCLRFADDVILDNRRTKSENDLEVYRMAVAIIPKDHR